ncbi:MAG: 16S rRNA (uracil(1498)-N(3))-methyltransferase [Pirellulaceae bacterium]|nr:16S rRNA (uracil(1498)-N(3))-methyltransferase [Pirellulaceae bacterium]
MSLRFFCQSFVRNDFITLDGVEAHHLLHVMRAKVGEEVILFDNSGFEYAAKIDSIQRTTVKLEVISGQEVNREAPIKVTIAVALPKGDRQRWLVEKCTEIGVHRLIPLKTARSVAEPNHSSIQRLQRFVIEAAKQCGRNRLMEISPAQEISALFKMTTAENQRLFAHPSHDTHPSGDILPRQASDQPVIFAIGPEGGFTEQEVQSAEQHGWQRVTLGNRILRTETAAITAALAAILNPHD